MISGLKLSFNNNSSLLHPLSLALVVVTFATKTTMAKTNTAAAAVRNEHISALREQILGEP